MPDLSITLGGLSLDMKIVQSLVREKTPNEANIRTLDGHLYTDYINNLSSWTLNLAYLCEQDFADIDELYTSQYSDETYLTFEVSKLDIDTVVKMKVSPYNFRQDGEMVQGLELKLEEQAAIS